MGALQQVSEEDFQQVVMHASKPVLVEFSAVWCGPCKRLEPELEKMASQWQGRVDIIKLDVDASIDLTMTYQVMSVPTLILFINGQPCERVNGYLPYQRLVEKFDRHIQPGA